MLWLWFLWCLWHFMDFRIFVFVSATVGVGWLFLDCSDNFGKLHKTSETLDTLHNIQKCWETELVEVLLGRISFRADFKLALVMDYTLTTGIFSLLLLSLLS